MAGSRFGRNVPLETTAHETDASILEPNPRTVSRELLTRTELLPAMVAGRRCGGPVPDTQLDVPTLMRMPQGEPDETFRRSPAGDIPTGEAEGTVLVAPGTELTDIAAKLIHLPAWKGKVFDPERGELRNEVLPRTSLVAHWIRDEIRLVAPNLYLGIVFWDHTKLIDFVLRFPADGGG